MIGGVATPFFGLLWHGSCVLALFGLAYCLKEMIKILRGANRLKVVAAILAGLPTGIISGVILLWYSSISASDWLMDVSISARYFFVIVALYVLSLIIGVLLGWILRPFSSPKAIIYMALISSCLVLAQPVVYYWLQQAAALFI